MLPCSHTHATLTTEVRIRVLHGYEAVVAFLQLLQGLIWRQSGEILCFARAW